MRSAILRLLVLLVLAACSGGVSPGGPAGGGPVGGPLGGTGSGGAAQPLQAGFPAPQVELEDEKYTQVIQSLSGVIDCKAGDNLFRISVQGKLGEYPPTFVYEGAKALRVMDRAANKFLEVPISETREFAFSLITAHPFVLAYQVEVAPEVYPVGLQTCAAEGCGLAFHGIPAVAPEINFASPYLGPPPADCPQYLQLNPLIHETNDRPTFRTLDDEVD